MIASELTAGLVILPSCIGTLKSTRIRTRLKLTSRSVIASLFERDMVEVVDCLAEFKYSEKAQFIYNIIGTDSAWIPSRCSCIPIRRDGSNPHLPRAANN